ncbi:MAG: sigma-70 family RNA polymerase sigma factor [Oscillospiraceae bacterium]|nr:sigma-70 family RNA polymerase sigma factor [Oscillospiraceae bacterium]
MKMSVATLNEEKLQKLFYFSLKKTGNPHEAEELVQETALEIIKMLNNGYEPDNFNAWMWTVAKKRFARWCKNSQAKSSRFMTDVVLNYFEIASDECVEESIIQNEDVELLHRELALMTKDYRDIIVSYYFDNKKTDTISKATGLPIGTVKRKLYEARKNIKEGMKMAKPKGLRSYAPEEIDFSYNVNNSPEKYPSGRPWNIMKRLAAKNIALEAYNNPSTVEELSLALGVAAPYIEDELINLLDSEVVIKHADGRIETNFVIIDAETQKHTQKLMEEAGKRIAPVICEVIEKNLGKIREIDFINHDIPKEYLYWLLLFTAFRHLQNKMYDDKNIGFDATRRKDGGVWNIYGYEKWEQPCDYFSTTHNTGINNYFFNHYYINLSDLCSKDSDYCMTQNELLFFVDILKNSRTKSSFNESENILAEELVKNHVISISGDDIKTFIPVFNENGNCEFTKYHGIVKEIYEGEAYDVLVKCFDSIHDIVSNSLPDKFKKKYSTETSGSVLESLICVIMRYAYKNGIIKIPNNENKSAITMYMRY